jgi:hypothetical protein
MLHNVIFCSILFCALFVAIDFSSEDAEAVAGSNIIVSISFKEANAFVDVEPGSAPMTRYEGEVLVSGDVGGGRIDINSRPKISKQGFLAAVFPMQLMILPTTDRAPISLDITAPLRANYTDGLTNYPVKVTVEGDWLSYPSGITGRVANSTVMLNVNQFYDISVSADPPFYKIWPGESAWFRVWIKNMGNGVDSFELSILNDEFYINMGFSFYADFWQVDVGPNMDGYIDIRVDSPKTLSIYESNMYGVTLKVVSKGSKMYESNVNPRFTIYDLLIHCKGAGIFYYFSTECWAMFLLAFGIIIMGAYNLVVYKKGKKRGVKRPVREHWRKRKEGWKASMARRREKTKARREIRDQKRAESKAKKDEERKRKEAEKKSKTQSSD